MIMARSCGPYPTTSEFRASQRACTPLLSQQRESSPPVVPTGTSKSFASRTPPHCSISILQNRVGISPSRRTDSCWRCPMTQDAASASTKCPRLAARRAIREMRLNAGKPLYAVMGVAIALVIVAVIAYGLGRVRPGFWPDELPLNCAAVLGLYFSPDARLLAVIELHARGDKWRPHVYVYRVSTGELVHQIDDVGSTCAWSLDGSVLAVAAFDPLYVDIWETTDWKHKVRLACDEPIKHKHGAPFVRPERLRFDQFGNLYYAPHLDFDRPTRARLLRDPHVARRREGRNEIADNQKLRHQRS